MRHFFSTRIRVVLVLVVLLAVGLAILSNLTGFNLPEMLVKGVLTPLRTAGSRLTDQAEQLYSYMFEYEKLAAENAKLKEQIAEMEDLARVADALSRENDRLRDLVELQKDHEDFVWVDAYIIGRDSNDWTSVFTINRGTNAGVEVGMCAITANGEVVGLITEAGANYAVLKTILDSSLEVSATIAASGYTGMVRGAYLDGQEGMLRMDYLPSSAVIRNQDEVVTSGSTVYPRDLIMGYVVDAGFNDTGVAKYALLQPAADIDTLEQVFIITQYNVG